MLYVRTHCQQLYRVFFLMLTAISLLLHPGGTHANRHYSMHVPHAVLMTNKIHTVHSMNKELFDEKLTSCSVSVKLSSTIHILFFMCAIASTIVTTPHWRRATSVAASCFFWFINHLFFMMFFFCELDLQFWVSSMPLNCALIVHCCFWNERRLKT